MAKGGEDNNGVNEQQKKQHAEEHRTGAVSVWVKDEAVEGMHEIERMLHERWQLSYDRPDLLRLIIQITIQLIEQEKVIRVGLHFGLDTAPISHPRIAAVPALEPTSGRTRGHGVWVGGLSVSGLQWIQEWLHGLGYKANRSDVLELAVDLSLQAFAADLVLQPKGPQVTVAHPNSQGVTQ